MDEWLKNRFKNRVDNWSSKYTNKAVQAGRRAKMAFEKFKQMIIRAAQVFMTPAPYFIIGGIFIIINIFSLNSILFKENFDYDCGTLSAPEFTKNSENSEKRNTLMMGHFVNVGMSEEQAAIISAYYMRESGGDPMYNASKYSDYDNEALLKRTPFKMGLSGNIDSKELAQYAMENSADWRTSSTQLRFLSSKMNERNSELKNAGFNDSPSAEKLAKGMGIEINNASQIDSMAKDINEEFEEDGINCKAIGDGSNYNWWAPLSGTSDVSSGGNLDLTDAVKLAWSYAVEYQGYPPSPNAPNRVGGPSNAGSSTKPELAQAYREAYEKYGRDSLAPGGTYDYYSKDCGRNVALAMKLSGTDPDYPWGPVNTQRNYMMSSPNYEKIDCNDRKPGDILIHTEGSNVMNNASHTKLYVGDPDNTGEEWFVEASLNDYEAEKKPMPAAQCNASGVGIDYSNRTMHWFRKIK